MAGWKVPTVEKRLGVTLPWVLDDDFDRKADAVEAAVERRKAHAR